MKQRLQAWGNSKILPIVCCLVFNDIGEILLLRRHTANLGGGKWGTPGGRIEAGETQLEAARRELWEETGLQPADLTLLGTHHVTMPHGTVRMTSFKVDAGSDPAIVLRPDEHRSFQWFSPDNILSGTDILWGIPTILHDFGFVADFNADPTLADGSSVVRAEDA